MSKIKKIFAKFVAMFKPKPKSHFDTLKTEFASAIKRGIITEATLLEIVALDTGASKEELVH